MTNIKEQTIPTAYSREVNVESTLKYMGEVITFLVLGNVSTLSEARFHKSVKSGRGALRAFDRAV